LLAPVAPTHAACGREVGAGEACAALGLHAFASRRNLFFLSLFYERHDPVVPRGQLPTVMSLTDHHNKGTFRRWAESLTGYELAHAGEYSKR